MASPPHQKPPVQTLDRGADSPSGDTAYNQTFQNEHGDNQSLSPKTDRKSLDQYRPEPIDLMAEGQKDGGVDGFEIAQSAQCGLQNDPGGAEEDVAAQWPPKRRHDKTMDTSDREGGSDQPQGPSAMLDQLQQPVVTHVAPPMAPDLDIDDEGYAESTTTSYFTSIASEISRGILENDRIYPQYGKHSYGMPVDEEEMERMELQHRKYEMVLGDRHFLVPIGDSPQKILDLGTGTGIWALDVADMFPTASVTGVDIAPIQPKWVAPNCQFEIDDVEADWTWKKNSFDFIHLRDPLYMIHDWQKLMRQIYDHLRPGGWCEIACIHPQPTSDDGSMPPDSGFKLICDKLMEASTLFGTPLDAPMYHRRLRDAGFTDVTENIFKIPSSPWPKDKRLKQIGALEMMNVIAGATAFGLRAFERVFGWSKLQTEIAMIDFKRDVKNKNHHQYCQYFVVYGRKPPDMSGMDF